jgi:hypothetical protein
MIGAEIASSLAVIPLPHNSTPQFSQLLVSSDKFSKAAIRADQQSGKSPNRGRHKVLCTGKVDVKFRRERALID